MKIVVIAAVDSSGQSSCLGYASTAPSSAASPKSGVNTLTARDWPKC